jgi:hypothetical protein
MTSSRVWKPGIALAIILLVIAGNCATETACEWRSLWHA